MKISLSFQGSSTSTNTSQDPRQTLNEQDDPEWPWIIDLFNIGPRRRLRLNMAFDYVLWHRTQTPAQQRMNLDRAVYMISVIRNFLLANAQELRLGYEGIRVGIWDYPVEIHPTGGRRQRRQVLVECDDEYMPESNQIRSHLVMRGDEEGDEPAEKDKKAKDKSTKKDKNDEDGPTRVYMAPRDPPPERQPTPPRAPSPARVRVRPQQVQGSGSALDQQPRNQGPSGGGQGPPGGGQGP